MVKKFYVVDLKNKYDIDLETSHFTLRLKTYFDVTVESPMKSVIFAEETDVEKAIAAIKLDLALKKIDKATDRYDFLVNTLSDFEKAKYKFTIETYSKFAKQQLNNSNTARINTNAKNHFYTLKFMIDGMSNDICNIDDDEIYNLLTQYLPTRSKDYFSQYLRYLQSNYNEKIQFTLTHTVIQKRNVKSVDDFYTNEEWIFYVNYLTDINTHIVKAFQNKTYAKYWLFFILHLSLAWRKNDILTIPPLDILDLDKYSLDWFYENEFTMSDALYIISNTKLIAEQGYTQKTGSKLHFNIPMYLTIPTAIAILISELWRRKINSDLLLLSSNTKTKIFSPLFDGKMDNFSSMKANRTLMSFANEKADELDISEGISIASYMRSHKMDYYNTSNTTLTYLKTTYDEKELNTISKTLFDKGAFGWLFDYVVSALDNEKEVQFKDYDIEALENVSNYLLSEHCNKATVINELMQYSKEELTQILKGDFISRQQYVYCSKPYCNEQLNNNCMECKYSIPTVYAMKSVSDEITTLLTKLQQTHCKRDKEHYLYRLLKLLTIAKSFRDAFGTDSLNVFLDFDAVMQQTQLLLKGV